MDAGFAATGGGVTGTDIEAGEEGATGIGDGATGFCPLWIAMRSNSPTGPVMGMDAGFWGAAAFGATMFCGGGVEVWLSLTTGCSCVARDQPTAGAAGGVAAFVSFPAMGFAAIEAAGSEVAFASATDCENTAGGGIIGFAAGWAAPG